VEESIDKKIPARVVERIEAPKERSGNNKDLKTLLNYRNLN